MKEKDTDDQWFYAGFSLIPLGIVGFLCFLQTINSKIPETLLAVLVALCVIPLYFLASSVKYILFDQHIVELDDKIRGLATSMDNQRDKNASLKYKIEDLMREQRSIVHVCQSVGEHEVAFKLKDLKKQFDAVNEHYGIEVEKQKSKYVVK